MEIQQEINKIQFAMDDLGKIGEIRELRLFEIVFQEEFEKNIVKNLNQPNEKIEVLSDQLRSLLDGLKIDGQTIIFKHDERDTTKPYRSPSVNILGIKEDKKHLDGREIL
jgi:hypothetical protein